MKKKFFTLRNVGLFTGAAFFSLVLVQCKKLGVNDSALDRSVSSSSIDSTIFVSFYDTTILNVATTKSINDVIVTHGVQSIIKSNCATANCHGGKIAPTLTTYAQISSLVTPGAPEQSKLWNLITTHDLNQAMPPVTFKADIPVGDKVALYNWIQNGANEMPKLADYRPAAIRALTGGCTSQCHNTGLTVGAWASSYNLGRALTAADTGRGAAVGMIGGTKVYSINDTLIQRVWKSYKDSVLKFYADTLANVAYKPIKTIGSSAFPLNTYNDILFQIMYPNKMRAGGTKTYGNPLGAFLTSSSPFVLLKVDSTLSFVNPVTNISYAASGNMAYSDGHLTPSEIGIIKGWYFTDTNIPDQWKYGPNNVGIFKDKGAQKITKQ